MRMFNSIKDLQEFLQARAVQASGSTHESHESPETESEEITLKELLKRMLLGDISSEDISVRVIHPDETFTEEHGIGGFMNHFFNKKDLNASSKSFQDRTNQPTPQTQTQSMSFKPHSHSNGAVKNSSSSRTPDHSHNAPKADTPLSERRINLDEPVFKTQTQNPIQEVLSHVAAIQAFEKNFGIPATFFYNVELGNDSKTAAKIISLHTAITQKSLPVTAEVKMWWNIAKQIIGTPTHPALANAFIEMNVVMAAHSA